MIEFSTPLVVPHDPTANATNLLLDRVAASPDNALFSLPNGAGGWNDLSASAFHAQVIALAKGFVAGCLVTEGKINRNASARVRRGKEILHEGKIGTLKRFKDDAKEVKEGFECGLNIKGYNDIVEGDVLEFFEIKEVARTL